MRTRSSARALLLVLIALFPVPALLFAIRCFVPEQGQNYQPLHTTCTLNYEISETILCSASVGIIGVLASLTRLRPGQGEV